jgi:hypothetical protein
MNTEEVTMNADQVLNARHEPVLDPSRYRYEGGARGLVRLDEVEDLLDRGMIMTLMSHGKWWKVRRNGQTKRWKTRPEEFRIPIKMGLYNYGYITHADFV